MFGSLGTKIAHATPSLGNQDLRLLQATILKEKEVVNSTQRLSKDFCTAADAMKQWGAGEGEDLADIANVAMLLLLHVGAALNTFADHELAIRVQLKEIRTQEEQLDELRRRRKNVASKSEAQEKKLSKLGADNKALSLATEQLTTLQDELRDLDTSILIDMARLSDIKRQIIQSILLFKFGGLVEMGKKFTIIGKLGKLLAFEIPQDTTPPGKERAPYNGQETTTSLAAEAERCMQEVTFNPNPGQRYSEAPNTRSNQIESRPASAPMLSPPPNVGDTGRFGDSSPSASGSRRHRAERSTSSMGRTMTPMRENARGEPTDEFGRPIDRLPRQANTMHARAGSIPQAPLASIQQSMRSPNGENGLGVSSTLVPSSSNIRPSPPSQGSRMGQQFIPPGHSQYPPQQRPQHDQQYSHQNISRRSHPAASGSGLERGLSLSSSHRTPPPSYTALLPP